MASFNERYLKIKKESRWSPVIVMRNCDGVLTDFVPYINTSPTHLIKGFPKNASFRFSGYDGTADKDRIIYDICQSTFGNGTRIRSSTRSFASKNRSKSIDFFCIRHKHLIVKSEKMFNENCVQAVGTIVQKEHQIKSVKGKRKSVTCSNSDSVSPLKKRKTTSYRPIAKNECCPFDFTVFLSEEDNLWFLLGSTR